VLHVSPFSNIDVVRLVLGYNGSVACGISLLLLDSVGCNLVEGKHGVRWHAREALKCWHSD
jgi:hypothetical protein